jgi:ribosome-associated protein
LGRPEIGGDELRFTYSRSSGPGGQYVNRVETRVTLLFDVDGSPSLTDEQKRRIRRRLATRINKEGVLRVVSQRHRTREANRRAAIERFEELLAEALRSRRPRRKTRVPERAKRRRVETKRRRGEVKRSRGRPESWDD